MHGSDSTEKVTLMEHLTCIVVIISREAMLFDQNYTGSSKDGAWISSQDFLRPLPEGYEIFSLGSWDGYDKKEADVRWAWALHSFLVRAALICPNDSVAGNKIENVMRTIWCRNTDTAVGIFLFAQVFFVFTNKAI